MSTHFGAIRQLGYVVRDIQSAMQFWIKVHGVGPFFYFDQPLVKELQYRGSSCDAQNAFAFAQSGPVQIELIAPLDNIPSLYQEFLTQSGEGLQHVAYWAPPTEFEALEAKARALDMPCVWSGYTGEPEGRFAYYDGGGYPGTFIELSSLSPKKKALFDTIARASVDWDGKEAIRKYAPA